MTVESGEVFLGFPPRSSEVHALVPGQSSFGGHGLRVHLVEAPHMHAGYPSNGSKALYSSESNHVQVRGAFFPFI